MRKFFLPALLGILLISCQKEVKDTLGQTPDFVAAENARLSQVVTKQTTTTWLNGQVLNEQGQPISGVTVTAGSKTTTTDNKGFFYFKDKLTVNKDYALITVSKAGYMTGFRSFTPNRTKLAYHTEKIMLQAAPAAKTVPSGAGGSITTDNIKLTFPAASVMKPGGYRYDGNISVTVRYIDPNAPNFSLMIPGTLSGLNDANQVRALQSFGMVNVELKDAGGQKLEIMPGKTVKMEMPAAPNGPATIPLWHFNETYGIWV